VRALLTLLVPRKADNRIRGSRIPFYLFVLIALIGTVRSCIHIFSSDGGAGSIAGMNLAVAGAPEIVFAFALWGSEQLVFAIIQWIVIFRYRSLVALMWVVQLLEILGRMLVGQIKPVHFSHVPPGQVGNYIWIVVSIAMVVTAAMSGARSVTKPSE